MRVMCVVLALAAAATAALDAKEQKKICDTLFEQESLSCKTCDLMEEVSPELSELAVHCRTCCGGNEEAKYKSATLEVDQRTLAWLPEVAAFVKEHAPQLPKLKVSYTTSRPTLVMKRPNHTDRVAIASWKQQQILDYLKAKLE
ncbi:hypothetical protein DIPPA_62814 [Diplonema papillatum]|nr:hypothetical protein DIPPA_62814 [Diplonema papillatum]